MINTTNLGPLIADKFSTSFTYSVGDYVLYYNKLYRCKTAVTTPGAFDSSKWDQTTVADEILAAKARLSDTN